MSTPNDDLVVWTLNNLPIECIGLMKDLDLDTDVNQLSTGGTDHVDSIFYSRGPLATIRTALLLFIVEDILPREQRWLFFWLVVYARQNLVRQVYAFAYIEILLLWLFPVIPPRLLYNLNLTFDGYKRATGSLHGIAEKQEWKTMIYEVIALMATFHILFRYIGELDSQMLAAWSESLLGPSEVWPWAIAPMMPTLLYAYTRSSTNAFIPEAENGFLVATMLWLTTLVLPKWIQWALYIVYSAPDHHEKFMFGEWVFCSLLWFSFDTPVPLVYFLHLFSAQFMRAEFAVHCDGGGPSRLLRRQRYGLLCFAVAYLFFRIMALLGPPTWSDFGFITTGTWKCVYFVCSRIIGLILVKLLAARAAIFQHEPLKPNNIRILRVRPSLLMQQSICCDLFSVDLASPPQYTAVSYRWPSEREKPVLITINNGQYPISRNLYSLLMAKRKSRHYVLLWIDAICINQADVTEKAKQVGLMRKIFEEADSTICWLGESEQAQDAVRLVKRVNEAPDHTPYPINEPEATVGKKAFSKMLSNPWFERVWIIQEIAVSRNALVRYGDQEFPWIDLVTAVHRINAQGEALNASWDALSGSSIANALVIENIRTCIYRIDYLRLEDVLKLGLIFKATLSVDKVFALLGISEEHNRPMLNLNFSGDIPDLDLWHAKNLFNDLHHIADRINDLRGTIGGVRNSRRSQAIRASPNGVKYLERLMDDSARIMTDLVRIARSRKHAKGKKKANKTPSTAIQAYDLLRPDYKHTTPEAVYSLVAKMALAKGDAHSILRHAGIGLTRNAELSGLPSFVPDWSSPLDSCPLPVFCPGRSLAIQHATPAVTDEQDCSPDVNKKTRFARQEVSTDKRFSYQYMRRNGINFHSIRGQYVGRIVHLATLSEDLVAVLEEDPVTIVAAARVDFERQHANHVRALAMVQSHGRYKRKEDADNAFICTILAGAAADGKCRATEKQIEDRRKWISGDRDDCPIATALRPVERQRNDSLQADASELRLERDKCVQICGGYLSIRQMQCSTAAKLASMVQNAILPSYELYRLLSDKSEDSDQDSDPRGDGKKHVFFLDGREAGPLAVYSNETDYTLGRRLAITELGFLSLVPQGARTDDIVVYCRDEELCLLLRSSEPTKMLNADDPAPSMTGEMARLVGEVYFHDCEQMQADLEDKEEKLFTLW